MTNLGKKIFLVQLPKYISDKYLNSRVLNFKFFFNF